MSDIDIQKLRSADANAFSMFYEAYVRRIYDFLYYKTFDQDLAEELTQETFFKSLKRIGTFKGSAQEELTSWIYTIAQNTVIDHFRSHKENGDIDEVLDSFGYLENFNSGIDQKETLNEVLEYLQKLSKDQREILIMRIWDDLSYAEISEITGKTVDTCKKIVSRGLTQIQSNIAYLCIFAHFLTFIYK